MTTRRHGCALLSAILTLVVALSAVIYLGASAVPDDRGSVGNALAAPASTGVWVGTWATAPTGGEPGTEATGMAGRTVRNVVHTSVGGTRARITLSNLYGTRPLTVTHATLAVAEGSGPGADARTLRRLTFGGGARVTVPAGEEAVSDAVRLAVPRDADLVVSTYSPDSSGPVTYHAVGRQEAYVADGEHTADATGTPYEPAGERVRYLTAVDVLSGEADGTVVAFGDSITDGATSTSGANRRWPDVLADRLHESGTPRYGVVNTGISGNRLLGDDPRRGASGVHRFERDVLDRAGVKAVIVDLGVNDILHSTDGGDSDAILAGLRDLVEQAHARGVTVIGSTITPFGGHRGYGKAREATRQRVNKAVRDGDVFDAVVDFDKALRDPYDPRGMRPDYDCGDHLHPSDRGYRAMADAVDLADLVGGAARL